MSEFKIAVHGISLFELYNNRNISLDKEQHQLWNAISSFEAYTRSCCHFFIHLFFLNIYQGVYLCLYRYLLLYVFHYISVHLFIHQFVYRSCIFALDQISDFLWGLYPKLLSFLHTIILFNLLRQNSSLPRS